MEWEVTWDMRHLIASWRTSVAHSETDPANYPDSYSVEVGAMAAVVAEIDRLTTERDRLRGEVAALRVANERLFRMMDRDAEACRSDDLQEVANIIQGYAQYLNPAYDAPPAARKERE